MTNEEAIALLQDQMNFNRTMQRNGSLYANQYKEGADALELAINALRAGGKDMNVPTMPAERAADAGAAAGDGSESLQRRTEMDYKKLSKNLKDAKWTNAGMTDDQSLEWDASDAITDLLARAEAAEERRKELEERCKRLNEARERANEAAAKWEGMYRIALEQAERAVNGRNKGECNGLSSMQR